MKILKISFFALLVSGIVINASDWFSKEKWQKWAQRQEKYYAGRTTNGILTLLHASIDCKDKPALVDNGVDMGSLFSRWNPKRVDWTDKLSSFDENQATINSRYESDIDGFGGILLAGFKVNLDKGKDKAEIFSRFGAGAMPGGSSHRAVSAFQQALDIDDANFSKMMKNPGEKIQFDTYTKCAYLGDQSKFFQCNTTLSYKQFVDAIK